MSLAKDQIYNYILAVGANPEIGYSTTHPVAIGDSVEYRNPTTGAITTHSVTAIEFREPTETRTPGTYQYVYIPNDFPPKTAAQIDPANMIISRAGFDVTRETGYGTSSKLTVLIA